MRLIIHWLITVAALFAAAALVPGIHVDGNAWLAFGGMALVLGVINLTVKPLLKLLSCSVILLTLGLFLLVINAFALWLASKLAGSLGIGYHVDSFWSAFLGSLIVSIVSTILGWFAPKKPKGGHAAPAGVKVTDIEAG